MFRIPTFAELIGLFYRPTKVAHAIKDIEAAAKRADSVVEFNQVQRDRAEADREEARKKAEAAQTKVADYQDESARAARVATRLRELVA